MSALIADAAKEFALAVTVESTSALHVMVNAVIAELPSATHAGVRIAVSTWSGASITLKRQGWHCAYFDRTSGH